MTGYERVFGTGPRGAVISLLLLAISVYFKDISGFHKITGNDSLRYSLFLGITSVTVIIIILSMKSLPVSERGKKLVTTGIFKYMRHPLYGAFLSFFNIGFAIFLNNWIYIIWAVIQHLLWNINIRNEEKLMRNEFPDYNEYCRKTWRFFPKFF